MLLCNRFYLNITTKKRPVTFFVAVYQFYLWQIGIFAGIKKPVFVFQLWLWGLDATFTELLANGRNLELNILQETSNGILA